MAECLAKAAYQVGLRQTSVVGQRLDADGLGQVLLNVLDQMCDTGVGDLGSRLTVFHEETEDDGHKSVQLHAFVEIELHVLLYIVVKCGMVVEGICIVDGQVHLGEESAEFFQQCLDSLVCRYFVREFI